MPEVAGDDQDGEATTEATPVASAFEERDGFECVREGWAEVVRFDRTGVVLTILV
jgi:hypothetical protein